MTPVTIQQLDAIKRFNEALRHLASECGIEEVASKTNLYLKTLPTKFGVWEMEMVMTPAEATEAQKNRVELRNHIHQTVEKARKAMEAKVAEKYYGINYGSEVTNDN